MNNQILVLLQGKAQTGKSTIANYLCSNYGYTLVDPGNLFKCVLGLDVEKFAGIRKVYSLNGTFGFLKRGQENLLKKYEAIKQDPQDYGYADAAHFRATAIAIAETARLVYPDIWAKSAFMLEPDFEVGIGFAQSLEEREYTLQYFDGQVIDVCLNCIDHGEEDTREPFTLEEVPSYYAWFDYNYKRKDSLHVAEEIHNEVRVLLS